MRARQRTLPPGRKRVAGGFLLGCGACGLVAQLGATGVSPLRLAAVILISVVGLHLLVTGGGPARPRGGP